MDFTSPGHVSMEKLTVDNLTTLLKKCLVLPIPNISGDKNKRQKCATNLLVQPGWLGDNVVSAWQVNAVMDVFADS